MASCGGSDGQSDGAVASTLLGPTVRLPAILLLLAAAVVPWQLADSFVIDAIEHRPTFYMQDSGFSVAGPPTDLRIEKLGPEGYDPVYDSSAGVSRYTYIGCFQASLAIPTIYMESGGAADPNECKDACEVAKNSTSNGRLIVAVSNNRCACVDNDMGLFTENDLPNICNYSCKYYQNKLCGGEAIPGTPNTVFWGVFREYDFHSMSSQGAFIPAHQLFYTVVALKETSITGDLEPPTDRAPERYYLHATSTTSGESAYEWSLEKPLGGIICGLQYDIDTRRLVGLFINSKYGRIVDNETWVYQLATITVNSTVEDYPRLHFKSLKRIDVGDTTAVSQNYFNYNGVSGIMSVRHDVYLFTQGNNNGILKNDIKDKLYVVTIPDGNIIFSAILDFKVVQLFVNERYGDITAIGPRYIQGSVTPAQQYLYLGRIYNDTSLETPGTEVDWVYNPIIPQLVTPISNTRDLQLYPGVCASEHLFNTSAIVHRYYPSNPSEATITIGAVNLLSGTFTNWCSAISCQGTMDSEIPFASIINREPGIPLTLKSPAFQSARFSLDGTTITVVFDRATLKGAKPVDDDGDELPDWIDYSFQQNGRFDCLLVFAPATIELLGEYDDAYCEWITADSIQIKLPAGGGNISVGDSIFVQPDVVYTVPQNGQFSPAATGGFPVSPPDPLIPPVAVLSGATTVDSCSPVKVSVVESYNIGGEAYYAWTWQPATVDQPNPIDITDSAGREFDQTRLDLIRDKLDEATAMNNVTLTIPADYFEGAASYIIILSLTGKWEATTEKEIRLNKLDFPAPSVYVGGQDVVLKKRTETVSLSAICTPSQCESVIDEALGYQWVSVGDTVDFVQNRIVSTSSALVIPPFTLEPPGITSTDPYREYNFTIQCFVDTELGRLPENIATDTVSVRVSKSDVYVQFVSGTRAMTQGEVLVLDARESQDPDYPTQTGSTFNGNFMWWCLDPSRNTCFGGVDGLLGSTSDITPCVQDLDTANKIQEGGIAYFAPVFNDYLYCKYARGVLMLDTTNMPIGEYKFEVQIEHYDGRTDRQAVLITIVEEKVPKIILEVLNEKVKYPITDFIKIEGTIAGDVDPQTTYSWTVSAYVANPEYNPEEAEAAQNDEGSSYNVDEKVFVDQSSVFDLQDPAQFVWTELLPNIEIKANVLQASTTYAFRLNVHIGDVTGFSSIEIKTAGLAPLNGALTCTPMNGSINVSRTITAPDWSAEDSPLSYNFGYMGSVNDQQVRVQLHSGALSVSEITVPYLPVGEESTEYRVWLYVDVSTPYGATTTAMLQVIVDPPENKTEAVDQILSGAGDGDGAELVNTLKVALSIDPSDPNIQSQVLETLTENQGDIPATAEQLIAQVEILKTMIDNGGDSDEVLGMLETLVQQGENVFDTKDGEAGDTLASLALYALGGLLPSEEGRRLQGRQAQRSAFDLFKNPKMDLSHRSTSRRLEAERVRELQYTSRRQSNHPMPRGVDESISSCPNAFCDRASITCFSGHKVKVCCNSLNVETLCNEPPCWFNGLACPRDWRLSSPQRQQVETPPTSQMSVKARRKRRSGPTMTQLTPEESAAQSSVWFDSWQGYNYPLADSHRFHEGSLSDFDRINAFQGWHPEIHKRRLQYAGVNDTVPEADQLMAMESKERPLLIEAQSAQAAANRQAMANMRENASHYAAISQLPPDEAKKAMADARIVEQQEQQASRVATSNRSARILKVKNLRLFIAKALAVTLERDVEKTYDSQSGPMSIGNTYDMTNARPEFSYPSAYVKEKETPARESYAYIFIEYSTNIYAWSETNPLASASKVMSVTIWNGDGTRLDEVSTDEPVRLFSNLELYSSTMCLAWDVYSETMGGSWSTRGIINNGNGCLSTHLSLDVGIFVDGRTASSSDMVDMAADWEREVWEVNCINCGGSEEYNQFVLAMMGMILFVSLLLVLMGYVADEMRRSNMRKNKIKSRYYYDGDGLTGPQSVDDCIDYAHANQKSALFVGTFLNVAKREHAVLGVFYYHETFTRPQRIHCVIALVMGILAVNSAVQSHDGYVQKRDEFVVTGILSGLLAFPMYCVLFLMFSMRPTSIKKRLIKRAFSTREIDIINDQRRKLEHQSAKRPPAGYLAAPPPPPGSIQGQQTLLAVPSPLPLPPMPAGMPGGRFAQAALPGLPQPPQGGAPGLPGMLQLPALPGMTANTPLPPPPRVPPPKGAPAGPAALMPPLQWPKHGPPPIPFPALHAPEGSVGGSNALPNLPMLPSLQGETGGTAMQLSDAPQQAALLAPSMVDARAATPPPLAPLVEPSNDMEAAPPPPGVVHEDGDHKMAPPDLGEQGNEMPVPGRLPEALTPPGQSPRTPPTGAGTPTGGPRGAGVGPMTPNLTPGNSARGSEGNAVRGAPPAALVAQHEGAPPLFIRGAPPPGLQGPNAPAGNALSALARMPGPPLPSMGPPVPSAAGPGFGGAPGATSHPLPPSVPPPPPPPREDDQAFVRRIRLTYMDKVHAEHEKHDLHEQLQALGTKTPSWVFEVMVLMPYIASVTFSIIGVLMTLNFAVKFDEKQEERWIQGAEVGLAVVVLLLEVVRVTMMTLVELRKYENRRKSKAGHFLPRQVLREGESRAKLAPASNFWHKAVSAPKVPTGLGPPKLPPSRPRFLPQSGDTGPLPPPPAKKAGPGGQRALPSSMPALPVAAPPKSGSNAFSSAALRMVGGTPPGGASPRSVLSGTGRSGAPAFGGPGTPSPGPSARSSAAVDLEGLRRGNSAHGVGTPQAPGTPQGFGPGPKLASAGEIAAARGGAVTPPSPGARSGTSLSGLAQSLSQQVQASRRNTPPPPPPGAGPAAGSTSPASGGAPPPSAPSAPPPSYSRPPSRPGTAGSQAKRAGAPTPPRPKTPPQQAGP